MCICAILKKKHFVLSNHPSVGKECAHNSSFILNGNSSTHSMVTYHMMIQTLLRTYAVLNNISSKRLCVQLPLPFEVVFVHFDLEYIFNKCVRLFITI